MARTQDFVFSETLRLVQQPGAADSEQGVNRPAVALLETFKIDNTAADKYFALYGQSIAAGATLSLDLQALTPGPDGGAISLQSVKAILVRARDTNVGTVSLAPNATDGWAGLGSSFDIELPSGEYFRAIGATGKAVGAASKALDIINDDGSNAAIVDILIVGLAS